MNGAVSLIIPTLNAEKFIEDLLTRLTGQSRSLDEIVVVDSSSEDRTADIVKDFKASHPTVSLHTIDRRDFNHGLTRDTALREWTNGEYVLFMSQDAIPANESYVENLLAPFADPRVGVVSGRQLPKPDARRFERLIRAFNYPAESSTRSKEDVPRYGIKTFYTSDVCAAYRRSAYLECGGFSKTMMSEDMYMAAKLIDAGYLAVYAADACVYHSHNFTPRQQYERNKAIGYFLENNADILLGASEIGEGKKLALTVSGELLRGGHVGEFCAFGVDCVARFLGNRAGRRQARAERPEKMVARRDES